MTKMYAVVHPFCHHDIRMYGPVLFAYAYVCNDVVGEFSFASPMDFCNSLEKALLACRNQNLLGIIEFEINNNREAIKILNTIRIRESKTPSPNSEYLLQSDGNHISYERKKITNSNSSPTSLSALNRRLQVSLSHHVNEHVNDNKKTKARL
ncbi:MAG: hypothetical protein JSS07_12405 [Proteobacteria bacterium]|nr:hypothetical protein [Pseudomonadota bacterium]